ncbi:hypothetical protein GCK32_001986 [Trichostrongylus colubriformis]|uniref:Uncharacterized protein n=1 Tax=Trichostrongylus colubriformis TaxID=6319 RepID=A0AAN8FVE8_TRICO
MARRDSGKGGDMKPLLKDTKKEESKVARGVGHSGDLRRSKIAAKKPSDVNTAREMRKSPPLLTIPSQSTQSLSPDGNELYPPEQIKVLRLTEIMDVTNSQSNSKLNGVRIIDKESDMLKRTETTAEKAVLDQVGSVNIIFLTPPLYYYSNHLEDMLK